MTTQEHEGQLVELYHKWRKKSQINPGELNTRGGENITLLHLAAAEGDVEAASALIKAGISPNTVSCRGSTALMVAASALKEDFMRLLVGYGADEGARNDFGLSARDYLALAKNQL